LLGFAGAIAFYAQPAAADPFSWQKIYPIIHTWRWRELRRPPRAATAPWCGCPSTSA